jgi:SAM-dependent methyltransferase
MNSFLRFWLASFTHPPWDTGISPPELLQFIQLNSPRRALDLGCGTGTNALTLARNGWQTTGVDFIPRSIRQARQKARVAGLKIHFFIDSVSRLQNISGHFDLILDVGCFHGLVKYEKLAYQQNLLRLLAPGGSYLLYGFIDTGNNISLPGITVEDVAALSASLELVSRGDGTDRSHTSTWLHFNRRVV